MLKNVIIYEGEQAELELANKLRHIAGLIEQGYTAGIEPSWEIVDEDE